MTSRLAARHRARLIGGADMPATACGAGGAGASVLAQASLRVAQASVLVQASLRAQARRVAQASLRAKAWRVAQA